MKDMALLLYVPKGCLHTCVIFPRLYSLLCRATPSPTVACARSRNNLRRILPDGFFGIPSMNSTPPANRLCRDTFCASQAAISFSVALEVACGKM